MGFLLHILTSLWVIAKVPVPQVFPIPYRKTELQTIDWLSSALISTSICFGLGLSVDSESETKIRDNGTIYQADNSDKKKRSNIFLELYLRQGIETSV
ncbi:hypothetical protein OJ253_3481 [Cryptosporidium canis]|uniref:Membrane magnesium transporter n=1 Tax=Cryptosporidium canis TaxID=195482 RepID=A0A9D5HVT0_9CRYT|nr:hypothetical protein OJ253_3481 [Cryptosporidium canis]